MSDECDLANDRAAEETLRSINAVRQKAAASPLAATGRCLWCDAIIPHGGRFCDADCRDMYEMQIFANARNGYGR